MLNDDTVENLSLISCLPAPGPAPAVLCLCVPAELCQDPLGQERATELLPPCIHNCFNYLSNNLHYLFRSRPFKESFPWIISPKDTTAFCTTLRFPVFIQPWCWNAGKGLIWEVLMTAAIFHSSLTRHTYTGSPKWHLTGWLHLFHLLALEASSSITAFQSSPY